MRILLIAGHGDGDPGACYNGYKEYERARAIVAELRSKIKGAQVDVLDLNTDLGKSVNCYHEIRAGRTPNFHNYNYVLEVHLNASASPATCGSMIYIDQSENGHSVEDAILRHLYTVGFAKCWDGVVVAQRQFPKGLAVQRACRKQGVSHALLETCFISSPRDLEMLNKHLPQVAQAIADGVMEGWGLSSAQPSSKRPEVPYEVKVVITDLNIRSGPGTDYSVIGTCPPGTYHIIDEETGKGAALWGKLKSGAGWISLDYANKEISI